MPACRRVDQALRRVVPCGALPPSHMFTVYRHFTFSLAPSRSSVRSESVCHFPKGSRLECSLGSFTFHSSPKMLYSGPGVCLNPVGDLAHHRALFGAVALYWGDIWTLKHKYKFQLGKREIGPVSGFTIPLPLTLFLYGIFNVSYILLLYCHG